MGKSKQTFRMKTVIFIFALIALASAQGVTPAAKKDGKAPAPAAKADPKPAPKPATPAAGDKKKDDAKKPAAPAKKDDAKKPAAPAKKDDKKPAAKKDDKKPADKKPAAKKDDKKPKGPVADRNVPNCCIRDTTNGRYMPAVCGTRRFLQAAKKPDTRNDGRQTFYCPKQTAPVVNKPAAPHPAPTNGPAKKLLRRMQDVKPKEDFTCKAYARRLQAAPAPAPKKDDKKPAAPAKKDDKKPAAPAKKDDKKPAAPAKKDDKKPADKKDAKKDDKKADKKPAAKSKTADMPVSCGSKVYGTVTYTCMKTTKRDVCLYTAP